MTKTDLFIGHNPKSFCIIILYSAVFSDGKPFRVFIMYIQGSQDALVVVVVVVCVHVCGITLHCSVCYVSVWGGVCRVITQSD